jgi:hypothetical protein
VRNLAIKTCRAAIVAALSFVTVTASGISAPAASAARDEIDSAQLAEIAFARVQNKVSPELVSYFNTVLYVSKAGNGPLAQRMFVFQRGGYGGFFLRDDFPVSTGRERQERYFTTTPTGVFKLDPNRMFRMHRSKTWDDAPMPYAMFLDVVYRQRATGIALHAATGKAGNAALGRRASGGCVRMPNDRVKALFEEIEAGNHRGMVPRFDWDASNGRTSTEGMMARDFFGQPVLEPGITVLLIIENFSGRQTIADAEGHAPV